MVTTRRSQTKSSPATSQTSTSPKAGSKRKGNQIQEGASKSQKQDESKIQQTLEQTLDHSEDAPDTEMEDANSGGAEIEQNEDTPRDPSYHRDGDHPNKKNHDDKKDYREEVKAKPNGESHADQKEKPKFDHADAGSHSGEHRGSQLARGSSDAQSDAVKQSERKDVVPSSILEKGLIYFFFRTRVGVDEPSSAADIARSYIVLRPFPHGAALGTGPAKTPANNNRVLAVPKKVLPKSPTDRFMVFVEHAGVGTSEIEANVLKGSEYATKTVGTRQSPAATLVGEGVYALTETGEGRKETHLAYVLTLPGEVRDVQKEIGLAERGSWVMSAKNPKQDGPARAQLPKGPDFPKEILEQFGSLRWSAARPEMLNYPNAQFLLIGTHDDDLEKATKVQPEDQKKGKEEPKEEIEKLEAEDEVRVEKLSGDHAVFADLGMNRKEYEGLKTTW